jgi:N-acetylmuramoyl-L-alanine amidase
VLNAKGVLIHYVGNPGSSAAANRNYFENGSGGLGVSAHYVVGLKGEILRCVPENETAQHAGKSYAPKYDAIAKTNNSTYIGIETCHPDASGKFSDITRGALIELVADICKRRGFKIIEVKRHYDVTGKSCPMYYVNNPGEWEVLLKMISEVIDQIKDTPSKEVAFSAGFSAEKTPSDWAKEAWEWAKKEGVCDGSRPRDNITREEAVTMLYRAKEIK